MKITVTNEEGKAIQLTISDEEYTKLFSQKKKTGYERVERGNNYWYVAADGAVIRGLEENFVSDTNIYDSANYYSDKTVAKNNARVDRLMCQLRRFAVEHREKPIDWIDPRNSPWVFTILGDPLTKRLSVKKEGCGVKQFGTIYFNSEETAKLAIDTFREELTWYFTEYRDSL